MNIIVAFLTNFVVCFMSRKAMKRSVLYIVMAMLLVACHDKEEHGGKNPVVRVEGSYLYYEDLKKVIPYGLTAADSVQFVQDFTRKWIDEQLLFEKAEHNVRGDEHIEKLVADYRRKLILNEYEQRLIHQKMSDDVTEEELREYYEGNKQLFMLEEPVIKGVFIKAPLNSPGLDELKRWYKDKSESSLEKMEKYAFRNAVIYEYFYDHWVPVSELEGKITINLAELGDDFEENRNIEVEDEEYCYLLHIEEYIVKGEEMPYEMAKQDIVDLLANTRRVDFMRQVKDDLYNQSMDMGRIKYYGNETEVMGDSVRGTNNGAGTGAR